ncbi:MAG: sugar kinase [Bifidobacteriaceae bacterium]|jgi:2-dehydro-3-deoxygluconokinase|nr:sugar kinase [Bifidobacteriaceae bacterium]
MVSINFLPDAKYDEVSLGEIMLRLDPGESRIKLARQFATWEGGGEYNVAKGLSYVFGLNTAVITAFADNEIGKLLTYYVKSGGVSTDYIKYFKYDGIGKNVRNGLNFTERGFGIRAALGVSDRANTAVSKMTSADIDLVKLFKNDKVKVLHTGGIFAALSENTSKTVLDIVKYAKQCGTIISYDLNFRPSLWEYNGGVDNARKINSEIAKLVDIMIGNEEDFSEALGIQAPGYDTSLKVIDPKVYANIQGAALEVFPNFQVVATTLRTVKTATINSWTACVSTRQDGFIQGIELPDLEIMDRVGGGDSFASGLIYGLLTTGDIQKAVNFGIAHGALAMTTPGDTSMASLSDVNNVVQGGTARVKR